MDFLPEITALCYKNALNLAVGTSSGQILLFDLRSPRPYYVKDHYYNSPIQSVHFQKGEGLVMSADKKIVKIWHENDVSPNSLHLFLISGGSFCYFQSNNHVL